MFINKLSLIVVPLLILIATAGCFTLDSSLVISAGTVTQTAIITDFSPYENCRSTAGSEHLIAWNSDDESAATVCTEAFAAVELREYLCQIFGLDMNDSTVLPILLPGEDLQGMKNIILVGQVCAAKNWLGLNLELESESEDAFLIRTGRLDGRNILAIKGQSRKGTLYGVYHLLYRFGCRWFAPGDDNQVIPAREDLSIGDINIQSEPASEIRGFWISNGKVEAEVNDMTWEGNLTDRGGREFFLWMARNGLNFFWNREKDWCFMKKLGIELTAGEHVTYYELLRPDKPYPYDHPLFSAADSLPDDPYPPGSEYRGDVNGDGRLSYAEAHPEWYGMAADGSRFYPTRPFGVNYCTSSRDGQRELMKNIIAYLSTGIGHNADTFSFWPLDGGEWCGCPECAAQNANATDRLLEMVYKIRKELKTAHDQGILNRDIPVHSLIYVQTKALPSRPLPPDFDYDNIVMTYFPIGRCYAHNFNDTLCTEINLSYDKVLREWLSDSCHYRGKLLLGEYYNISGFRDLPLVFTSTMTSDIRYYLGSGIRGMHYMHPSVDNMGVRRLINYQMARMLWEPGLDKAHLLDDYYSNFYGPVSSEMKEFYGRLETTVANVKAWRYFLRPQINAVAAGRAKSLFPLPRIPNHLHLEETVTAKDNALDWKPMMEEIGRCRDILDRVMQDDLPPTVKRRIAEDDYGFRYLELSAELMDCLVDLIILKDHPEPERDNALRRARRASQELKAYRIKSPALGVADAFQATDLVEACRILLEPHGNN